MTLPIETRAVFQHSARAWVYKVNSQRGSAWHFDQYFRYRGRRPFDMGGREWIRSPMSWQRLRRVRRGDLFICYQSDERKIYGLARAASPGYQSLPGLGLFDSVDFAPPKLGGALRLANPVDVRGSLFPHLRAFTVPSRGTIHAVAADELRALLGELVAANPAQRRSILAFVRRENPIHRGTHRLTELRRTFPARDKSRSHQGP